MALNLITNIGTELTLSSQWGDLSTLLDQVKTGIGNKIRVHSLTNWDSSTTKPAIAEGSLFDVGGSLYLADSDTALTDEAGLIDGICHIKLVPAVDGLTVVPTLTNDSIPAWDETKHGWYDVADSFLPYEFTKASAVYSDKKEYENIEKTVYYSTDGSIGSNGIFSPQVTPTSAVLLSGTLTQAEVYTAVSPMLPNVGDKCLVSGSSIRTGLTSSSTVSTYTYHYAARTSTTNIKFYLANVSMFFSSGSYTGSSQLTSSTDATSGSSSDFVSGYTTKIAIGTMIP